MSHTHLHWIEESTEELQGKAAKYLNPERESNMTPGPGPAAGCTMHPRGLSLCETELISYIKLISVQRKYDLA